MVLGAGRVKDQIFFEGRTAVSNVVIENQGGIGVLRLNNGVTNAISPDLVKDLEEALPAVAREFRGLVLAGGEKFFCMGFDLPALITMTREALSDFFYGFNRAVLNLYTLSMPTCCAIAGHAVAGGNILALGCDYRFAAKEKKLGLNEIKLGLPVPYLADMLLRQIAGDRAATDMIYCGDFVSASDAARFGLADALFLSETVEAEAIQKVSGIASHSQAAFSEIKKNRVEAIRGLYEQHHKSKNEAFLDCWFSDPVQGLLEAAARKF